MTGPTPRKRRAATAIEPQLERQFFDHLRMFYVKNRGVIRRSYSSMSRQFLDHNDPAKNLTRGPGVPGGEPLRQPQFEALEMYVFLKEYAGNKRVFEIFDAWFKRHPPYENREDLGVPTDASRQGHLLGEQDAFVLAAWEQLAARMKAAALAAPDEIPPNMPSPPPNYIFALSMGVGKTRLMGVCILYEFFMAKKFPKSEKYAHNALVFAPDTTVREALREIEQMDYGAYLPACYANTLPVEIKTRVLDDDVTTLQLHDGGDFHLIISNVQKILVKKRKAELTPQQKLFAPARTGVAGMAQAMADEPEDDADLTYNQRFNKLLRAPNLAIYVDEAHHAFGENLASNLGQAPDPKKETAFRRTVRLLIDKLDRGGSRVIGTFCYTGTPYSKGKMFAEVVYYYGLRQAIDKQILKQPRVLTYENVRDEGYITDAMRDFTAKTGGRRYEGLLPKMAIFAKDIRDATDVLRPLVEKVALELGYPASAVLINTSDEKTTTKDDERAFRLLDTPGAEQQFIILVGKGKEGWNCRSLFGVALFREPKSAVFILQATMRCLRSIDGVQHQGHIYLSAENEKTLDAELKQNFNLSLEQFRVRGTGESKRVEVRPQPPPRLLKLKRIRYRWDLSNKVPAPGQDLGLANLNDEDTARYVATIKEITHPFVEKESLRVVVERDVTAAQQRMVWSPYQLVAECARYLCRSPMEIAALLSSSADGMDLVVARVNQYNELLWDHVIPALFKCFHDVTPTSSLEEVTLSLAPVDRDEPWVFHAKPELVVDRLAPEFNGVQDIIDKTFHVEPYCFDSRSEQTAFFDLVKHGRVKQIYCYVAPPMSPEARFSCTELGRTSAASLT